MMLGKRNAFSENREVIDLVDDWGYKEEKAKEIFENKKTEIKERNKNDIH